MLVVLWTACVVDCVGDIASEFLLCVSVQKRSGACLIGGVNIWQKFFSLGIEYIKGFSDKIRGVLLRVVGDVCYSEAFRQGLFGNWDLALFNCNRKATNKKNSLQCVHREQWDTAAAVSLCGEMALCGPWAILEISPVRPETNTASGVMLTHQLRVRGRSKCQLVFVDEKSRRASLEPLPFPVWRKHPSLPERKLAGKPSYHTWKTISLSSHSLLSPAGGSRSWASVCETCLGDCVSIIQGIYWSGMLNVYH